MVWLKFIFSKSLGISPSSPNKQETEFGFSGDNESQTSEDQEGQVGRYGNFYEQNVLSPFPEGQSIF